MNLFWPTLLIFFTLFGCSSNSSSPNGEYSHSTLDEFNKIESSNYLPVKNQNTQSNKVINNKNSNKTEAIQINPTLTNINRANTDEHLIELNQNLAIYCMKKSRARKYKSEKQCQKFVKEVLLSCESVNKNKSRALVACVKKKLQLK